MKIGKTAKIGKRDLKIIAEFKRRVQEVYPEAEIVLFGSVARGDQRKYSDIDLLVVLDREVNTAVKEQIYDLAYDIELENKNDILLGPLVESREFWESDLANSMPLKWNVVREGVKI